MAPPAYVVRSVDDDCMASDFPGWPADSFSIQQEPVSSSSSSSAFAASCEDFSSTHVWSFCCQIRTSSEHKDLGQNSGDEDLEREEEEDGEEEEEQREAGGVVKRMICAKEGAGEGLDDEGRASSSATGGGGDGWEGASGISQTGGRSEAAAGEAGGENRGPRDGEWFRISDSCSLALHRGDITKWFVDAKTDAIVNAANEAMLGGGGVDGAIHSAAGPELLDACYAVPEVTRGVRCPTGSAVITGGFNLPASKVIHTVGPIYSSDEVSAEPLAKAYRSSVAVATGAGVKYIAFPAISCGVYGYPHKKAAKIAIQTLKESSGGLLEVHFVLFNESVWNVWLAEAEACLKKA